MLSHRGRIKGYEYLNLSSLYSSILLWVLPIDQTSREARGIGKPLMSPCELGKSPRPEGGLRFSNLLEELIELSEAVILMVTVYCNK